MPIVSLHQDHLLLTMIIKKKKSGNVKPIFIKFILKRMEKKCRLLKLFTNII